MGKHASGTVKTRVVTFLSEGKKHQVEQITSIKNKNPTETYYDEFLSTNRGGEIIF